VYVVAYPKGVVVLKVMVAWKPWFNEDVKVYMSAMLLMLYHDRSSKVVFL